MYVYDERIRTRWENQNYILFSVTPLCAASKIWNDLEVHEKH